MLVEHSQSTRKVDLESTVEREVAARTWGRLSQLRVEQCDDRLIVRGYTSHYYIKQLAIQAVMDSLQPPLKFVVQVDIQVGDQKPGAKTLEHREDYCIAAQA